MTQQQAALPFKHQSVQDFAHYVGNQGLVDAMKQLKTLPQFIYIWGAEHAGKSHLLNAFVQYVAVVEGKDDSCFVLDADYLTEVELLDILPEGVIYLLLDDVDKLAGQARGEVALFNVFNHCRVNGITLLLSASIHSKSTVWQLPDLISRLNSGLNLKAEVLQGQAALDCFAQQFVINGMPLDAAVFHYLQSHHSSDYSQLYRLFLSLLNESLKLKRKVTVPLVKQAIADLDKQRVTFSNLLTDSQI